MGAQALIVPFGDACAASAESHAVILRPTPGRDWTMATSEGPVSLIRWGGQRGQERLDFRWHSASIAPRGRGGRAPGVRSGRMPPRPLRGQPARLACATPRARQRRAPGGCDGDMQDALDLLLGDASRVAGVGRVPVLRPRATPHPRRGTSTASGGKNDTIARGGDWRRPAKLLPQRFFGPTELA